MLAFTTATDDQPRGWEQFDSMVLWAVGQRPASTLDHVAAILPAGITYHLIDRALEGLCAAGRVVGVIEYGAVRYKPTLAGRKQLFESAGTHTRPGHQAAA
jgi:hypothetical protein